jgi:ERCC4-type nuclease
MQVILDSRERDLYDICKHWKDDHEISVVQQTLLLGDISIQTASGEQLLLIERKTTDDLLSSIKDNRYEEQSYRLIHSSGLHRHNIYYLIEQRPNQFANKKPIEKQIFYSSITSLSYYKGFSIITTSSIQETADWIFGIAKKINIERKKGTKQPAYSNQPSTDIPDEYCTVVKKQKKANITPENMGAIILCQVPMVSSTSAIAIMNEYKTLVNLIKVLSEDSHALDNMKVNNRKLSKTIISNIYSYLSIPNNDLIKQPHNLVKQSSNPPHDLGLEQPSSPIKDPKKRKAKVSTKVTDTEPAVKKEKPKKPKKPSIPISVCLIDTNLL